MKCETCESDIEDLQVKVWKGKTVCPDCFVVLNDSPQDLPVTKPAAVIAPSAPAQSPNRPASNSDNIRQRRPVAPPAMRTQQRTVIVWVFVGLATVSHFAFFQIPLVEYDPSGRKTDVIFLRARQRVDVERRAGTFNFKTSKPANLGGSMFWGIGLPIVFIGVALFVKAGSAPRLTTRPNAST